ncbi:MAG: hypothetical protein O3A21_09300 [Proteobacteria bacterium]|nr:hypothetical protein [Pseudomonadota bacterium]
MANEFSYSFDRFSILVVEDSGYMKTLMASLLKDLGFGRVETASDGSEAIEFLKLITTNPQRAGIQTLDIVIHGAKLGHGNGGYCPSVSV